LLLLLNADHLLHRLRLCLLCSLLHADHLLVLEAFFLQARCFLSRNVRLLSTHGLDRVRTLFTILLIFLSDLPTLMFPLAREGLLLLVCLSVTLAHLHDVIGLLLSLLDFFPSLTDKK
jgi:hypothetical protein